jgi:transposase
LFEHEQSSFTHLSEHERFAIVALWKLGEPRREIAHEIPCSLNTVDQWIQRWQSKPSLQDKPGRGRKRKANETTDVIVDLAIDKKFITPREIIRELQLPLSHDTVRRRLNESGLFGRVARKEYPFTEEHIRKRLSFANGYGNWKEAQWDTVLFSDECHIELGQHGQVWVQRPLGAAFESCYMAKKLRHPDRLSIWGCISSHGVGELHTFNDTLDAPLMRTILSTHLLPSAARLFHTTAWWYQQDNDPKHTSRIVQQWLFSHGIQMLDFPPYSPDLNPIENLWANLKPRVEARNARNIDELEQHVQQEWVATDPTFLSRIVHSMPRRCKAVVQNSGHKTHY